MDRSTDRPEKLYAVHLPSAGCWMAISSPAVARALEETYEVIEFVPGLGQRREELLEAARAHLLRESPSSLSLRVRRQALAEFLGVKENQLDV